MSDDTKRKAIGTCIRCGWPTYERVEDGCTPLSCSERPMPPTPKCDVYDCDNDATCVGPEKRPLCNDHKDTTPTPADLARELIRLRKAATQGTWKIENSHWTGKPYNVLVENVIDGQVFHPWVLMKFLDGWSPGEADAAIIVYAVNHARTIAEALLAAEADRQPDVGKMLDALMADNAILTRKLDESGLGKGPPSEYEATGDELIDRLRGIYTVPVNDGAGLLNGKDTFTRRFPTVRINLEAADRIAAAEARVAELEAACGKALAVIPSLMVRSWPPGHAMKQEAVDTLRDVLAKGKGATP